MTSREWRGYRVQILVEHYEIARSEEEAVKKTRRWHGTYGLRPKILGVKLDELECTKRGVKD